jgi:hypothetical protein
MLSPSVNVYLRKATIHYVMGFARAFSIHVTNWEALHPLAQLRCPVKTTAKRLQFRVSLSSCAATAETECPCITMGICTFRRYTHGNQTPARVGV